MNRYREQGTGEPADDEGVRPPPRAPRKRPSRWHRPIWWVNVVAVGVLLITYLAPHVSPRIAWPLALLAFTFPYQLAVHLLLLAWWALFRRKRMLLSGIALLLGIGHIGNAVQLFGTASPDDDVKGAPVKLMSYNVRLFDLYNWAGNKRTRNAIFDVLKREDADILCLQEFFQSNDKRYFRTRDALLKEFRYTAVHERYSLNARYDQHFGIATFSVHPIVGKGHVPFARKTNNVCIWTDIAVKKDTIRVYNAHLASYHFGDADYKFIADLDTDTKTDSLKSGGWRILMRLKDGAIHRAEEVKAITAHMEKSPHPVVFCGDINDVPMSYAYHTLRGDRDDAFVESGSGLGGTYLGRLPNLRIDHLLHDPAIASWDFHVLPEELSDHSAITAMIAVR